MHERTVEDARPCPHYPRCVGCRLIGLRYTAQLEWKQVRLKELVQTAWSSACPSVGTIVGSPEVFGYRNQAKLVLRRSPRRGFLAGLYRPGTHSVVDIRNCPVHHPSITSALQHILPVLEKSGLPTYDERSAAGTLRYLVVRSSRWARAVQVILVTATELDHAIRGVLRQIARLPRVRSVVHNWNPSTGNVIFGETFTPITSEEALVERIGDFRFRTRAGAFLQANILVARRIYEYVARMAEVEKTDLAADLYSGAGALAFHIASGARMVFAAEESPIAAADARANVRLNGLHNVRVLTAPADRAVALLQEQVGHIDVVTLNPPRKGADEATRLGIVGLAPRRIVYVSCDPKTLIRDLLWFEKHQYRCEQIQPFDMFPQTDHVECVATLTAIRQA